MSRYSSILDHVIQPGKGNLSEALAQYILSLDFPKEDRDRYQELSAKADEGLLSLEEKSELEEFLNVNDFLATVQAKARRSLGEPSTPVA